MDTRFETKTRLAEFYKGNAEELSVEIRLLKKRNRAYILSELLTFGLALTAAVFYCLRDFPLPLLVAALAMLAAYVVVRRLDVRNGEKIDTLSRLHAVYVKELKYLDGDFACFDDGNRYSDPSHAYTFDMDMFGHDSLYNRICRTVTTGGADCLASWLGSLPPSVGDVVRRRIAINELAPMEEWRAGFMAMGQAVGGNGKVVDKVIDTDAIRRAVGDVGAMDIAPRAGGKAALTVAWTAIVCLLALIALAVAGVVPASFAGVWGVAQMFIVIGLNLRSIRDISRAVEKLHAHLGTYIRLIKHIEGTRFASSELVRLQTGLSAGSGGALKSFGQLSDILKALDRRGNFIGLILFNMFALNDYFLVRKFLKWQRLYMADIAKWLDCVSQVDALVSMATFRFNEPAAVDAEVVDADNVVFEAEGLYHPFLGDKAVRNDFTLVDGNYYIVTGANMAGKSTFLRSVGVNYVLAMNGMAVFASRLRVSVFSLFSSMRTSDDLSRGISYFNAELLRLKQLIGSCRQSRRTLIILDEILKGTNSLDKLNGSRLFLQSVAELPVTGIIATHDLELSKMENEDPQRFHNWCFEIELADNITYTYKITRGVARNQNATFLLKGILGEKWLK